MVGEIVHLQVGGAGNRIGNAFWKLLLQEHSLNERGVFVGNDENVLEKLDVYCSHFTKGGRQHYSPRGIVVDLDPDTFDIIRPLSTFYKPDNVILGGGSTGGNWAKGHFTDGAEIGDELIDVVRKEIESCEHPQGVEIFHSLGGGTGSGLGTLVLQKLKYLYPELFFTTYPVFPSTQVSSMAGEYYNVALAMKYLTQYADMMIVLDNESFFNMCTKKLQLINFDEYAELNRLISYFLSDVTSCFRFPSEVNNNMEKMASNMIPFPLLKYLMGGLAPITLRGKENAEILTTEELTSEMFKKSNLTIDCNPKNGKYLTTWTRFRGNFLMNDVDDNIMSMKTAISGEFADWPDNILSSVCAFPLAGFKASSSLVGNNTAISDMLTRMYKPYKRMLARKYLMHMFKFDAMNPDEFSDAETNLKDLIDANQNAAK